MGTPTQDRGENTGKHSDQSGGRETPGRETHLQRGDEDGVLQEVAETPL